VPGESDASRQTHKPDTASCGRGYENARPSAQVHMPATRDRKSCRAMARIWWTVPAALIAGVAAAGALACDDCTDAGCFVGASVLMPSLDVPRAVYSVRVCVDGACRTQRMELLGNAADEELRGTGDWAIVEMPIEADEGETVRLDLKVEHRGRSFLEAGGTAVVRMVEPNGPDCTPQCPLAQGKLVGGQIQPLGEFD
jgi:hypothetical protein